MTFSLIQRYFPKTELVSILTIRIFINSFNVLVSIMIQMALALTLKGETRNLPGLFLILGIIAILYVVCFFLSGYLIELARQSMTHRLSTDLVLNLLNPSNDTRSGEAINLLLQDIENVSSYVDLGLLPTFDFVITVGVGCLYVGSQSLVILFFFIVTAVALMLFVSSAYRSQSQSQADIMQIDDEQKTFFDTVIHSLPTLRNLGVTSYVLTQHDAYYVRKLPKIKQLSNSSGLMSGIFSGGVYLSQMLILLIGYLLVKNGRLPISTMLGTWNAGIGSILWPFLTLPPTLSYVIRQRVSVTRLLKRINHKDRANPTQYEKNDLALPQSNTGFKQAISIHGVDIYFKYDTQAKQIFRHFSFSIKSSGMTYIMGPSGAGKTTLIRLLLGLLIPDSGNVEIDGGDRTVTGADLMGYFSLVPQRSVIFDDTLKNNLAFNRPYDGKETDFTEALISVGLDGFVSKLNSPIAEDQLSIGQLRRLSIARAVMADNPFLILDEPFSDIDDENQAKVVQTLQDYAREHGVIVVTHTSDMIRPEDNVIKVVPLDEKK